MALPENIETPEDAEDAELAVRGAIMDCFLNIAGNARFGFDASHIHDRARYPDSLKIWEEIALIDDPEMLGTIPADIKSKTIRYFSVEFIGQSRLSLTQWNFNYAIKLSFGFKDTYTIDSVPMSSSNELTACLIQFAQYLFHNLNLGLDDSVQHNNLVTTNRRFVPSDAQGDSAEVFDNTLAVTLEVC